MIARGILPAASGDVSASVFDNNATQALSAQTCACRFGCGLIQRTGFDAVESTLPFDIDFAGRALERGQFGEFPLQARPFLRDRILAAHGAQLETEGPASSR